MKIITIFSDDHSIELHNSILGKETVKINGQVVSSEFSFLGTTHSFNITKNGQKIPYKVKFRAGTPVAFDIYREGEPLIESPPFPFWRVVIIAVLTIFFYELIQGRIF
jgi:hypothetical protein